ncbi:hypothetical protein [Haloarcula salinisoli]|uniref:Uncharacterized protein n=1 Tax=Haloarcula salinisoli TaxID=2487746 RepID=A0A8J7YLC1_9EURY|nr:hypothetical protein [Halomicroarcula salinisoli]MBX0288357.1 hypothetical protein [Halomicroarcula salinisoli]MBX0305838.1 hypothetical protein [Halomicroarcula salinisoli]
MTDNTPTTDQRILLDVIGNIPSAWDLEITYPTLPEVTHRFDSLPELVLTAGGDGATHEIAVRAIISADRVFHGYTVTTTYPEPGILTAACRERRLTSLTHRELRSEGLGVGHHPGEGPDSETAIAQSLSLSAAATLAVYYADTVGMDAVGDEEPAPETVPTADD